MPAETHTKRQPPTRQEIVALIAELAADILELDPSVVTESSHFANDLGADSIALIELVEAIEEELGERTVGFQFDDEDLGDLQTVRDAVDYVESRI